MIWEYCKIYVPMNLDVKDGRFSKDLPKCYNVYTKRL